MLVLVMVVVVVVVMVVLLDVEVTVVGGVLPKTLHSVGRRRSDNHPS